MLDVTELASFVEQTLKQVEAGIKASGNCRARVRQITFGGDIVFSASPIARQTTEMEHLDPSVTVTEEAKSTQTQESSDTLTQTVQRGGDKIFGRESTSSE